MRKLFILLILLVFTLSACDYNSLYQQALRMRPNPPTKDTLTPQEMEGLFTVPSGLVLEETDRGETGYSRIVQYTLKDPTDKESQIYLNLEDYYYKKFVDNEYRDTFSKYKVTQISCGKENLVLQARYRDDYSGETTFSSREYWIRLTNRTIVDLTIFYKYSDPTAIATQIFRNLDCTTLRNKAITKHNDE